MLVNMTIVEGICTSESCHWYVRSQTQLKEQVNGDSRHGCEFQKPGRYEVYSAISWLETVQHYPSSARRIAGSRTSANVTLPLPNVSTVSTQAAAAPMPYH